MRKKKKKNSHMHVSYFVIQGFLLWGYCHLVFWNELISPQDYTLKQPPHAGQTESVSLESRNVGATPSSGNLTTSEWQSRGKNNEPRMNQWPKSSFDYFLLSVLSLNFFSNWWFWITWLWGLQHQTPALNQSI